MNKNLMPEIAELLGVKLGESFAIKTEESIFRARITTSGLHINYDSILQPDRNNLLCGLLQGLYAIQRPSWEPKDDEKYWSISFVNKLSPYVESYIWNGDDTDFFKLKLGMVYRTQAEARAHLEKDYERLTGRKLHENA